MAIQERIRSGFYSLIWSYMMDYENYKNPFIERRDQISKWQTYALEDVEEDEVVLASAKLIGEIGIKKMDALHIACASKGHAEYFLTTDDWILKRANLLQSIKILDPIAFIKEVFI